MRDAVFYHWQVQLDLGAAAKRSARWRRETSLEPPQRHESPDWHSSSLRHVTVCFAEGGEAGVAGGEAGGASGGGGSEGGRPLMVATPCLPLF